MAAMIEKRNLLLVGSGGRNIGKTEFACSVIRNLAEKSVPAVGLKITVIREGEAECPRGGKGCGFCASMEGHYALCEELPGKTDPGKDTARMLDAGAKKVFWLRVMKNRLEEGISFLFRHLEEQGLSGLPLVAESNSARLAVEPGLFVMIKDPRQSRMKETAWRVEPLADIVVEWTGEGHDFDPRGIVFETGSWHIEG